ncbi:MAG: FecR domain-containing protein, partial [Sandaracinaceae bacterium]|nr:FecR domain-containing protein [Sandaracinaceae bacterium]
MRERLSIASEAPLDRLARAAGEQEPRFEADDDAVIREALVVGRARARTRARRQALGGAAGALALAAASHHVEALPGARLEARDGGWRLGEGAALFDVTPGAPGGFVVETPDATVLVRGTIFAVHVEAAGTAVEVYEGRVEVRDTRGVRALAAGESFATRGGLRVSASLAERGARAARARAGTVSTPAERVAHGAGDPRATDPRATDPRATDPSATDPSATDPSATDPSGDVADEPVEAGDDDGARAPAPPAREVERAERVGPPRTSVELAEVRALVERGAYGEALDAIAAARPRPSDRGELAMLEGDALRALGRGAEAAAAYERAAGALSPTRA